MALWIVYFTLIASGHFVSGQSSVTSGDTASETVRTSVPGGSSVGAGGYNVRSPTGVRSAVPGLSSLTQTGDRFRLSSPITRSNLGSTSIYNLLGSTGGLNTLTSRISRFRQPTGSASTSVVSPALRPLRSTATGSRTAQASLGGQRYQRAGQNLLRTSGSSISSSSPTQNPPRSSLSSLASPAQPLPRTVQTSSRTQSQIVSRANPIPQPSLARSSNVRRTNSPVSTVAANSKPTLTRAQLEKVRQLVQQLPLEKARQLRVVYSRTGNSQAFKDLYNKLYLEVHKTSVNTDSNLAENTEVTSSGAASGGAQTAAGRQVNAATPGITQTSSLSSRTDQTLPQAPTRALPPRQLQQSSPTRLQPTLTRSPSGRTPLSPSGRTPLSSSGRTSLSSSGRTSLSPSGRTPVSSSALDQAQPWQKEARLLPLTVQKQIKSVLDRTGDTAAFRAYVARMVARYLGDAQSSRRTGVTDRQRQSLLQRQQLQQRQRQLQLQQRQRALTNANLLLATGLGQKGKSSDDESSSNLDPLLVSAIAAGSLSRPTDRQLSPASGTVQSRARNPQVRFIPTAQGSPSTSFPRTQDQRQIIIRRTGTNTQQAVPTGQAGNVAPTQQQPAPAVLPRQPTIQPAGSLTPQIQPLDQPLSQQPLAVPQAVASSQNQQASVVGAQPTNPPPMPDTTFISPTTAPTQPSAVKPAPTPLVTVMPTNPLPPSQPVPTFQPTTSTPSALTTQTSQPQPQPATNFLNELPPSLGLSPDEVMARMPPNVAQNETLRALFFEMITRARLKAMEARQQSQVSNTDRMTTQPQTPVISTTPSPVISSTNPQANPTTEPPPQAPVVESPANAAAPSPFVILLPKESGGVASSINIDTLKALLGGGAPSLPSTLQAAATETPQVPQTTQPPATTMIPGTTPQQIITTVTTTPLPPTTTFLGIVLEPAITFSLSLPESSIHNIRSPSMHTLLQPMISATIGKAETAKSKIEQFKTALYDTLTSDPNSYVIVTNVNRYDVFYARDDGGPTILVEELLPGYLTGNVDKTKISSTLSTGLVPVLQFEWMFEKGTVPTTATEAVDIILARYGRHAQTTAAPATTQAPAAAITTPMTPPPPPPPPPITTPQASPPSAPVQPVMPVVVDTTTAPTPPPITTPQASPQPAPPQPAPQQPVQPVIPVVVDTTTAPPPPPPITTPPAPQQPVQPIIPVVVDTTTAPPPPPPPITTPPPQQQPVQPIIPVVVDPTTAPESPATVRPVTPVRLTETPVTTAPIQVTTTHVAIAPVTTVTPAPVPVAPVAQDILASQGTHTTISPPISLSVTVRQPVHTTITNSAIPTVTTTTSSVVPAILVTAPTPSPGPSFRTSPSSSPAPDPSAVPNVNPGPVVVPIQDSVPVQTQPPSPGLPPCPIPLPLYTSTAPHIYRLNTNPEPQLSSPTTHPPPLTTQSRTFVPSLAIVTTSPPPVVAPATPPPVPIAAQVTPPPVPVAAPANNGGWNMWTSTPGTMFRQMFFGNFMNPFLSVTPQVSSITDFWKVRHPNQAPAVTPAPVAMPTVAPATTLAPRSVVQTTPYSVPAVTPAPVAMPTVPPATTLPPSAVVIETTLLPWSGQQNNFQTQSLSTEVSNFPSNVVETGLNPPPTPFLSHNVVSGQATPVGTHNVMTSNSPLPTTAPPASFVPQNAISSEIYTPQGVQTPQINEVVHSQNPVTSQQSTQTMQTSQTNDVISGNTQQASGSLQNDPAGASGSNQGPDFNAMDYYDFLAWLDAQLPTKPPPPPPTTTTTTPRPTALPPVCPSNQAVKCGPIRKSNRMAALCEIKCDVITATCDLSVCQCTCVATVGELSLQLAPKRVRPAPTTTTTPAPLPLTTVSATQEEQEQEEGD